MPFVFEHFKIFYASLIGLKCYFTDIVPIAILKALSATLDNFMSQKTGDINIDKLVELAFLANFIYIIKYYLFLAFCYLQKLYKLAMRLFISTFFFLFFYVVLSLLAHLKNYSDFKK